MAGAMRKMAVYLGLVEDQDRYDDEFVDDHYDDLGADDHLEHTAEPVRRADSDLDGRGREHAATVATLAARSRRPERTRPEGRRPAFRARSSPSSS